MFAPTAPIRRTTAVLIGAVPRPAADAGLGSTGLGTTAAAARACVPAAVAPTAATAATAGVVVAAKRTTWPPGPR